ncbi:MAG: hypothetical protein WC459_03500 [Patescibacteria group bacterium]
MVIFDGFSGETIETDQPKENPPTAEKEEDNFQPYAEPQLQEVETD